jgi:uncharacterized protein (TIGR03083 family)
MDVAAHIEVVRTEGGRLAAAAEAAGPDAPVPSCPEWVVRDLVQHQGGVHRWATGIVAQARIEPWNVGLDEVVGSWPSDADLFGWFLEGHAMLVAALESARPDLECWTFLAAPSPLAMWARRQAHETAIHRADAELAAGRPLSTVSANAAADGIDELLNGFIPRRGGKLQADPPTSMRVRCTDADVDAEWLVQIGPGGVTTTAHGGMGNCEVAGAANDLYLTLWNRRNADRLEVEGEAAVLATFTDLVHVTWS